MNDSVRVMCESCGSNSFRVHGQLRICEYCGTQYKVGTEYSRSKRETGYSCNASNAKGQLKSTDISLDMDVQRLLDKAQKDPAHAHKYIQLALDIDPNCLDIKSRKD